MFKKSFAEMLKENLTEDSFKPPDKTTFPEKRLLPSHSNPSLEEVYQYYITIKDIEKIYGSRSFYKKLFKEPVKMVFYWCEEDWQGSLFVIYQYKSKYIYVHGGFGSCEICDAFPQTEEELLRQFERLQVCEDITEINIHRRYVDCTHPDLVKDFEKFKNKILKPKRKLTQNTSKNTTQESNQTIHKEVKREKEQENKEIKKPVSWASLFK